MACSKRSDGSHSLLHPLAVFPAHFSFALCPLFEHLEQASLARGRLFLLVMELFTTNVHGERTRDKALGTQSAWEARNRLYQYIGWKNLVLKLNIGPSYVLQSLFTVSNLYSDP